MNAPHIPAPWSFAAGRQTEISFGVTTFDEADETVKDFDISASRYTVHLRAWTSRDSTALLLDGTISKSSTRTNWARGPIDPGAVERSALFWEAVLIDSNTADTDSPSDFLERRLFTFTAPVDPAPTSPAP